ncbi:MAG: TIR domain-containing protein [Rhodocyclaceae bacterium]|nr:TIR domain-containing protein [Rhodocyclaceae bacterium]
MPLPLLVHLIFHPASDDARKLAMSLHDALNDDPAIPGLRVPTVLVAEDGSGLPPADYRFLEAERNVIVLLADDRMAIEASQLPAGRRSWPDFAGWLGAQCDGGRCRLLPFQLSPYAWPIDPRLGETSFLRAYARSEASRAAWMARALVVETSRYLQGEARGERAPVRLFLSHAKQDVDSEPRVFDEIAEHLDNRQPVRAWIDSGSIPGGSRFAEEIEAGVEDSALLILATRHYGARPWCRKEMLLAKRHQRPFVVVDALTGVETRSFPYAGNAPKLRWEAGAAERAVDLLLKETLRHQHARLVLAQLQRAGDVVLAAPPELATVVRLAKGSHVLYPDPPLGDEEMEELAPLDLTIETPLQRAAEGHALAKMPVALSISVSPDLAHHGLTAKHLDAALVEISRQLLVRGAVLEYGGHLGSDGYTQALFDMAREYAALSGLPPAERIINDVGWPLPLETLLPETRAKNQRVGVFRRIARPEGVEALDPATFVDEPAYFPADSAERRYAWARGMSAMRAFQCGGEGARARIVLGGQTGAQADGSPVDKWYSGRIPGVIEEALLSLRHGQPLFVIGAFGGAAAMVAELLQGRRPAAFSWDFQKQAPHAEAMRALYLKHGQDWEDYEQMAEFFADSGVDGLAAGNRLSAAENRELFACRDLGRIVELLLTGLARVNGAGVP